MNRSLRFLSVALTSALVVAACGGGGTPAPTTGGSPGASQSAGASGGSPAAGGTITVTSLWGGSEQENFQKVLDAFTAKTGINVTYESIRTNYSTVLQTRISGGNPPDVSILPGIGFLRHFAKDGSIKKIADLGIDGAALEPNYAPGILDIGKVDGELYGIMVKFNSKSTLWFRPDKLAAANVTPPKTWDEFKAALATLKTNALGLGTSPDTWTLTDWFESIYLRQAGADKYDQLFSGALPWTDPSVQTAVDSMKEVLNDNYVAGGIQAAQGRAWVDGIAQVFGASATADMYYEGGFVGGIVTGQVNKDIKVPDEIDWTDFPSFGGTDKPVTIGGDVIAALTTNPGVKEFIEYMTTKEAGEVWAKTGAIISPVKSVDVAVYPNDLTKRESAQVTGATAVRFDGSDLLPGTAGGDLGTELQNAIGGKTVDWAAFESKVKAAWAAE
jgi:alpha-glucoside transport system substrate-binding protein